MAVDQASSVALSDGSNSAQTVVFISLGYGFSLLVTAWGWYRISGGLFNPAVCYNNPTFSTKPTPMLTFHCRSLLVCAQQANCHGLAACFW